jgi:hypothetical protein
MSMTARQVVEQAISDLLERESLVALGSVKTLEDSIGIWEWGKWALKGEGSGQHIKRQLKWMSSRSEMTAWEAIPEISDEEGMQIDKAVSSLAKTERDIIRRIYMLWESTHDIPNALRLPRNRVIQMRDMSLACIAGMMRK